MHSRIQTRLRKTLHQPQFVFVRPAVTHAEQIRKLETETFAAWLICRVDSATDIDYFPCRNPTPIYNLPLRKLRNSKDEVSATGSALHHCRIIQVNRGFPV